MGTMWILVVHTAVNPRIEKMSLVWTYIWHFMIQIGEFMLEYHPVVLIMQPVPPLIQMLMLGALVTGMLLVIRYKTQQ